MPVEEWLIIEGYEDYQISNLGRVKSYKHKKQGCLMKLSLNGHGYCYVHLYDGTGLKSRLSIAIHMLVAKHFISKRPERLHIDHLDGNKLNNTVGNLEYVTTQENIRRGRLHRERLNVRTKNYLVTFPEGDSLVLKSLTQLTRDLKAHESNLYAVANGQRPHYKGIKISHAGV